jgi:hypothetical protein
MIVTVELTEIDCGRCGGTYAINERYREDCEFKGASWHCPYCECSWGYSKNNERKRLKSQIARLETANDQVQAELSGERRRHNGTRNSLRTQKGVTTKLKNRAKAGMCPVCHRTFKQLKSHMDCKHPGYAEKEK